MNGIWLNKDGKKICYNPWTHFEVNNPNGDVTMCCDVGTIMGNVNHNSIEEIWNGVPFQKARKEMYSIGGEKMCSPNCLLLNGGKNYQSFSWYQQTPHDSECYKNSQINEIEISQGKTILESEPRWMRFMLTYDCNYECYHCYQEGDRALSIQLPKSFIDSVIEKSPYFQFKFLFGGEPLLDKNFPVMLRNANVNFNRFGMVTNGSLIHKYQDIISSVDWSFISVSLDAANSKSYLALRKSSQWDRIVNNLKILSDMKKQRHFVLTTSMTLNTVNYNEILEFTRLSVGFGADPKFTLVSDPGFDNFYKEFLDFNKAKIKEILSQIDAVKAEYPDVYNQSGLEILKNIFTSYNSYVLVIRLKRILSDYIPPYAKLIIKRLFR